MFIMCATLCIDEQDSCCRERSIAVSTACYIGHRNIKVVISTRIEICWLRTHMSHTNCCKLLKKWWSSAWHFASSSKNKKSWSQREMKFVGWDILWVWQKMKWLMYWTLSVINKKKCVARWFTDQSLKDAKLEIHAEFDGKMTVDARHWSQTQFRMRMRTCVKFRMSMYMVM